MDIVITVCDQAAAETCPVWARHPAHAHWGAPDSTSFMDDPVKTKQVIREVFHMMQRLISLLTGLPMDKLDRLALQNQTQAIANKPWVTGQLSLPTYRRLISQ